MYSIAIISTHPIQYNAPWFALLNEQPGVEVKVFYTWSQRKNDFTDKEFGKEIKWNIPLLEGYEYSFIQNIARDPGNHHFRGIRCPALIKDILAWNPTHLLVMGWNFTEHLKAMRFFKGRIPVLFRGDSTLLDDSNPLKSVVRRIFLWWIYRHIDAVLSVGLSNRAYFQAHGLKEKQLHHAPHAIDNDRFSVGDASEYNRKSTDWRTELGIIEKDRTVLFAAKLIPKKDPLLLLRAFHIIKKNTRYPHLKLLIVGDGPLLPETIKISQDDPDVLFLPFQNQAVMPVVYRLGDLFCLPSSGPGETWGLAVNEAMASGRPCLISDKAGCATDLGKYPGNRVFRSGDVNDLADKLDTMLDTKPDKDRFDNTRFLETWSYRQLMEGVLTALKKTDTS